MYAASHAELMPAVTAAISRAHSALAGPRSVQSHCSRFKIDAKNPKSKALFICCQFLRGT